MVAEVLFDPAVSAVCVAAGDNLPSIVSGVTFSSLLSSSIHPATSTSFHVMMTSFVSYWTSMSNWSLLLFVDDQSPEAVVLRNAKHDGWREYIGESGLLLIVIGGRNS